MPRSPTSARACRRPPAHASAGPAARSPFHPASGNDRDIQGVIADRPQRAAPASAAPRLHPPKRGSEPRAAGPEESQHPEVPVAPLLSDLRAATLAGSAGALAMEIRHSVRALRLTVLLRLGEEQSRSRLLGSRWPDVDKRPGRGKRQRRPSRKSVSQRTIGGGLGGRDLETTACRRQRRSRGSLGGRSPTRPCVCNAKLRSRKQEPAPIAPPLSQGTKRSTRPRCSRDCSPAAQRKQRAIR